MKLALNTEQILFPKLPCEFQNPRSYLCLGSKSRLNICFGHRLRIALIALLFSINSTAATSIKKQKRSFHPARYRTLAYIAANIGYSYPNKIDMSEYKKKFRPAFLGAVALGVQPYQKFRAEVSAIYRGKYVYNHTTIYGTKDVQKFSSTAFLVNGYLMPVRFKRVHPYLMGGIGIAFNDSGDFIAPPDVNDGRYEYEKQFGKIIKTLTWQLGLGSTFDISERFGLDLSYRYACLGKFKNTPVATAPEDESNFPDDTGLYTKKKILRGALKAHEITAGIIYRF